MGPLGTAFLPRSAAPWRPSNARSRSRMSWLNEQRPRKDRRMQFRIGINVGDVMLKDEEIFGDGVNIAARLEGLADPGGICISRGIHDHVMKKLPFEFEDLGEQTVKNIAQPVRVYRLLLDERASELRSSPAATPSPDARPRFRRFPKASLSRRFPTRRPWKSSSGTNQKQHPRHRVRSLSRAIS